MASITPSADDIEAKAAPAPRRRGAYRWYVVGVLFLGYAFSAIDARVLTLLVGPIKADLGLSDFEISLLQGFAFAILYSVAAMPIGRYVDGATRRTPLMVVGVLFWSAMTMSCGLAKSFHALFLTRVGVGVGEATLSPTAYSLLSDYFEKQRRALAISFYAIGYPIGSGLALIIGGLLLQKFSHSGPTSLGFLGTLQPWQMVFVAVGAPGIIVAALIATIKEPPRSETGGLGLAGGVPVRDVIRYLVDRWRLYGMLMGVTSLSGLLAIGTSLWYPTFLIRTYGMTPTQVGLYFGTLMLVCGTIGTLAGGWFSGVLIRRGRSDGNLRVMLFATVVKALPLVIGPLMPTATLALAFMAVGTLVGQASQGVILSAIQDVTPNRLRGQITSLTLLAVNLIGLGLGSSIIAGITDFGFGDEGALRYAIAITGAIMLPIMAILLATGMKRYREALSRWGIETRVTPANRSFVLVSRPRGIPEESDFTIERGPLPEIGEGEFLIRNHFASIDPAMRGWLDDRPSYLPPVALGDPMRAGTIGEVVQSKAPGIAPGVWVKGINALQDYSVGRAGDANRVIDPARVSSMSQYISVAGGAGLTAYVGVNRVLRPQAGETLLVSSAAGAVGSVAGQLARLAGARVIGIAGGADKCRRLVDELGFDHAIDHRGKDEAALLADLATAAPDGLDMVFENVGGPGLDAALLRLKKHARIALCGLISEYNSPPVGARNLKELIFRSATMRGFTLLDFPEEIAPGTERLIDLANSGALRFAEQIEQGLENAFATFLKLFVGGTNGKLILQIA